MATGNGLPKPDYAISDLPEHKHQRKLLACIQVSRPVTVDGKYVFLASLGVQPIGGKLEMLAYINGMAAPVDASQVLIHDISES